MLELLGLATARFGPDLAGSTAALVDAPLTLWIEPFDGDVTLRSPVGDLTVHGFRIAVTPSVSVGRLARRLGAREAWR